LLSKRHDVIGAVRSYVDKSKMQKELSNKIEQLNEWQKSK